MKKIVLLLLAITIAGYAQCLSVPINTRVGLKVGFNPGTYDPDDDLDELKGTGMHFGLGMGTDFLNLISLDMGAQFRTTKYSRTQPGGRRTYSYSNLYFPIFLSLKAGMLPMISPYIGIGLGINVQFDGKERWEPDGIAIETPIEGSNTNAFLILGLGAEIKLIKLRISPEFTANINSQADDPDTPDRNEKITDYHLSVGFYYAP
jgi:hypothetical protein